jgi:peptidoglycan/xylan/chitin deacetylase (PgdA/CDA1 family)
MDGLTFEHRMQWLQSHGYRVRSLDDGLARLSEGTCGPRDVVLTFDDAWRGFDQRMLPVLRRLHFPCTLYVPTASVLSEEPVWPVLAGYLTARATESQRARLAALLGEHTQGDLDDRLVRRLQEATDATARSALFRDVAAVLEVDVSALVGSGAFSLMSPQALRAARAAGVDVQLHTHGHSMHGMDPDRVRSEIETNRRELAQILDISVPASLQHFCYPSGEHDPALIPLLQACGIVTATTTEFGLVGPRAARHLLPRILDGEATSLIEFEARLSGFWNWLERLRGLARA